MPLYDVSAHDILSPAAKTMATNEAGKFAANELLAESLLGISAVYGTTREDELAALAIALQVNFQLAQGIDPFYQESGSSVQTKQSVKYRDVMVDPRALQVLDAILVTTTDVADVYDTLTSVRAVR